MATETRTELSRDLGLFTITVVGVGAMIGAGIFFVLTGIAAGTGGLRSPAGPPGRVRFEESRKSRAD